MKPTYSRFTDILIELTSFSKRVDTATATTKDLAAMQPIPEKLNQLYKNNSLTEDEYQILGNLYFDLYVKTKEIIALNLEIKQIEREIDRDRKKSA